MPKQTCYEEMGKVFKLKRSADEEFPDFAARAAKKINGATDDQWKELTEKLQTWNNTTLKALEEDTELPKLEGWPDDKDETEGEGEAEETTAEADDEEGEASDEEGDSSEDDEDDNEESSEEDGEEDAEPEEDEESSEDEQEDVAEEAEEGQEEASEEKPSKKKADAKAGKKQPEKVEAKTSKAKDKPPAKPAKAGKAKDVAKAVVKSGRASKFNDADIIKLLVKDNPHREGSGRYDRWKLYKEGMTIKAALKAGFNLNNIRYSVEDGHIKIIPAAKSAKVAKAA